MKGMGKPKQVRSSHQMAMDVQSKMNAPSRFGRFQKTGGRRQQVTATVAAKGHPTKGKGWPSHRGKRSNRSSRALRSCKAQHRARMIMRAAQP
jgi:hypothetical protein